METPTISRSQVAVLVEISQSLPGPGTGPGKPPRDPVSAHEKSISRKWNSADDFHFEDSLGDLPSLRT